MELEKQFYPYADDVYYPKETTVTYLVEITDNFAIGFAEWLSENKFTMFGNGIWLSCLGNPYSSEEILQIYKSQL